MALTSCVFIAVVPLVVRSRLAARFIVQTSSVSLTTSTLPHSEVSPTPFVWPLSAES